MPDEKHEGWSNLATWGVAQVIDNDEEYLEQAIAVANLASRKTAAISHMAEALRDMVERMVDLYSNTVPSTREAMAMQLIQGALAVVNWRELAQHYFTKASEATSRKGKS